MNPAKRGTKAAAHYLLTVGPGASETIRLRIADDVRSVGASTVRGRPPFGVWFDYVMTDRRHEADEYYETVIPPSLGADAANVMRQALAGMLWSKQFYNYDVDQWLAEHGADQFARRRPAGPRNDHWQHMYNADVISMPDKWEYPWYAAWDLAFHVLTLTMVDEDFGKRQLELMLGERYLHPSGQIPAYEWNFGDVNPPVHAWATIFTYRLDQARRGRGDTDWLERCFHKLLLNFTWWVNRKDRSGSNVFEGGFLGLDNIGVFDRSAPLPTGGYLEQADGTAWMALFCQNMLEICAQLALEKPAYGDMCLKFVEHFLWIASSMAHAGDDVGMWDEEDGFFYDVLQAARRRGKPPESPLDGRSPAALRGDGLRRRLAEEIARAVRAAAALSRRTSPDGRLHPRSDQAGRKGPPARRGPERGEPPPGAGENARRAGVPEPLRHPVAVSLPRAAPVCVPGRGPRGPGCRTCRPSPTAGCSAGTPTGAGRYGCRSTP